MCLQCSAHDWRVGDNQDEMDLHIRDTKIALHGKPLSAGPRLPSYPLLFPPSHPVGLGHFPLLPPARSGVHHLLPIERTKCPFHSHNARLLLLRILRGRRRCQASGQQCTAPRGQDVGGCGDGGEEDAELVGGCAEVVGARVS